MASAEDYRAFIEGLPEDQRAVAVAAGLDRPPEDGMVRTGLEIRDSDGLPLYSLNGTVRAAPEAPPVEDGDGDARHDLARALRAVLQWLLRDVGVAELFKNPQPVIVKTYALARLLGLNDFADIPVAQAARMAGLTRAALSKAGCGLRDTVGQRHFQAPGDRNGTRHTARQAALRSWEKRRGQGCVFRDNS